MGKLRKTILLLAFAPLSIALSAQPQDWEWKEISRGAEYGSASFQMSGSVQSVSAVRYPASELRTELVNDPGKKRRGSATPSAFGRRYSARAVINGSYFNMKTLYPTTYIRDDRKEEGVNEAAEAGRVDGVFAIDGHDCFVVPFSDTLAWNDVFGTCHEIMAAGPVLLTDGEVRGGWPTGDGFYDKRHPRSLVGISADGYVYFIVIDGRQPGKAEGATIPETAEIALLFGLRDAINLDGGGSSALWVKKVGVISHPSDNHQFDNRGERKVPNALVLR